MDKYNNISSFINKNNKKLNILILQQLLLAQINLFKKFKYTHNDIHLGNILYKKHKDPITLNYKYIDKKIKDVKIEIILSDYDNVFEFTNENIERYILNELNSESSGANIGNFNIYLENSLISNLIKTTNVILNTNKEYLEKFNKIFENNNKIYKCRFYIFIYKNLKISLNFYY
jgi:hypothetical protein